jgi:hypothetical protein
MTDSTPGDQAGKPGDDWPSGRTGEAGAARPLSGQPAPARPVPAGPTPAPAGPPRGWGADALPTPPAPAGGHPAAGAQLAGGDGDPDAPPVPNPTFPGAAGGGQRPAGRRRTVLIASVAAVVVIAAAAAALTGALNRPGPLPVPAASTVTLASPTPTIQPAARTPVSTFADALPSAVLGYALTAVAPQPSLVAAGALEGYKLDYSDGGTGTMTVYASQWESADQARAAYTALLGSIPAAPAATPSGAATAKPTTGTVTVGGQQAGSWTVSTASGGTGTATWTNGTALFQAVGPAQVVADFYSAFPL